MDNVATVQYIISLIQQLFNNCRRGAFAFWKREICLNVLYYNILLYIILKLKSFLDENFKTRVSYCTVFIDNFLKKDNQFSVIVGMVEYVNCCHKGAEHIYVPLLITHEK
jgi:hypothetical protein